MKIIRNETCHPEWMKDTICKIHETNLFDYPDWAGDDFWFELPEYIKHIKLLSGYFDMHGLPVNLREAYLEIIEAHLKMINDLLFTSFGISLISSSDSVVSCDEISEKGLLKITFWSLDHRKELSKVFDILMILTKRFPDKYQNIDFIGQLDKLKRYDSIQDIMEYISKSWIDIPDAYLCAPYMGNEENNEEVIRQNRFIKSMFSALSVLMLKTLDLTREIIKKYDYLINTFRESKRCEHIVKPWRRDYNLTREQMKSRLKEKIDFLPWVDKCCLLHEGKIGMNELVYDTEHPDSDMKDEKENNITLKGWMNIFTISAILQEYDEYNRPKESSSLMNSSSPDVVHEEIILKNMIFNGRLFDTNDKLHRLRNTIAHSIDMGEYNAMFGEPNQCTINPDVQAEWYYLMKALDESEVAKNLSVPSFIDQMIDWYPWLFSFETPEDMQAFKRKIGKSISHEKSIWKYGKAKEVSKLKDMWARYNQTSIDYAKVERMFNAAYKGLCVKLLALKQEIGKDKAM